MTLTDSQQRNVVSEGMAFGLLLGGHDAVPSGLGKTDVDLSFEGAFRDWAYASRYPVVANALRKFGNGSTPMLHAREQNHTTAFYWAEGWPLTVCRRDPSWDAATPSDVAFAVEVIDSEVPAASWADLADDFWYRLVNHGKRRPKP
jgi:hypothetical protein